MMSYSYSLSIVEEYLIQGCDIVEYNAHVCFSLANQHTVHLSLSLIIDLSLYKHKHTNIDR